MGESIFWPFPASGGRLHSLAISVSEDVEQLQLELSHIACWSAQLENLTVSDKHTPTL